MAFFGLPIHLQPHPTWPLRGDFRELGLGEGDGIISSRTVLAVPWAWLGGCLWRETVCCRGQLLMPGLQAGRGNLLNGNRSTGGYHVASPVSGSAGVRGRRCRWDGPVDRSDVASPELATVPPLPPPSACRRDGMEEGCRRADPLQGLANRSGWALVELPSGMQQMESRLGSKMRKGGKQKQDERCRVRRHLQ